MYISICYTLYYVGTQLHMCISICYTLYYVGTQLHMCISICYTPYYVGGYTTTHVHLNMFPPPPYYVGGYTTTHVHLNMLHPVLCRYTTTHVHLNMLHPILCRYTTTHVHLNMLHPILCRWVHNYTCASQYVTHGTMWVGTQLHMCISICYTWYYVGGWVHVYYCYFAQHNWELQITCELQYLTQNISCFFFS